MRVIGELLSDRAEQHPDRAFLRWRGVDFSYAEAAELTHRHADAFLASGVRRGDHVALFLDNHPDFLWCLWGLGTIGAVAVPLNTAARGDMLHYYLTQSGAVWIITSPAHAVGCVQSRANH
jgi:crotonobetaine/carnitine-CoA ligase